VLDVIFIAAPTPLYSYYTALPRSAAMISAMSDQSSAGGIMNGTETVVLVSAIFLLWRSALRDTRNANRLGLARSTVSISDAPP